MEINQYFSFSGEFGLFIGLMMMIKIIVDSLRDPSSVLNLKSIGVITLWLGYQLSPLIAYFQNYYDENFLLVPKHLNEGVLFSSLCMLLFYIGAGKRAKFKSRNINHIQLSKQILFLPIITIFITTFCFIISVGGVEEILISSKARGAKQWNATLIDRIISQFSAILSVLSIGYGCYFNLVNRAKLKKFISFIIIISGSLIYFHGFSRAAGLGFILLVILTIYRQGVKNNISKIIILSIIGFYLSWVGYVGRAYYYPGLQNFTEAVFTLPISSDNKYYQVSNSNEFSSSINTFDSMPSFTRKVSVEQDKNSDFFKYPYIFIYNLTPLPSSMFSLKPLGKGLTETMGTQGKVGITTPALSETYIAFGYLGCLFFFLLGKIYNYFQFQLDNNFKPYLILCYILLIVALFIGLHSSSRAMTRPVLYAVILNIFMKKYIDFKKTTE